MIEVGTEHRLLETMVAAFARGDNVNGEALLGRALDEDLPWDEVTTAAARGVALRYGSRERRREHA